MYAMAHRAVRTYASVGLETGIDAADPHKLVLMLFEGAILALADARGHMEQREIAAKGAALSKAIGIIQDGLKASLDVNAGGELAEKLAALYEYMVQRLLMANMHDRADLIEEVSRLLGELRGAWEQIGPVARPAAGGSANAATAASVSRAA